MLQKKHRVNFTNAKLLKDKKFDCLVDSYFYFNGNSEENWEYDNYNSKTYNKIFSMPEHWQVLDWLKDVHDIDIIPVFNSKEGGKITGYSFDVQYPITTPKFEGNTHELYIDWVNGYKYVSSKDAIEAGIEYTLTKILK